MHNVCVHVCVCTNLCAPGWQVLAGTMADGLAPSRAIRTYLNGNNAAATGGNTFPIIQGDMNSTVNGLIVGYFTVRHMGAVPASLACLPPVAFELLLVHSCVFACAGGLLGGSHLERNSRRSRNVVAAGSCMQACVYLFSSLVR